jgi:two-component system chemotaxis response regulator CheB
MRTRLVAIGASTGGPQALTRILRALPGDLPAPVAVVVHMPPGYTAGFAERLAGECRVGVVEASEGLRLRPGLVAIARAGVHMKLRVDGGEVRARLDVLPLESPHRPSVSVLFESAAEALGGAVLGVVLTGMGDDGLSGARRLRAAGARILTQSEASCVVYACPRVEQAGLSDGVVALEEMAAEIVRRL